MRVCVCARVSSMQTVHMKATLAQHRHAADSPLTTCHDGSHPSAAPYGCPELHHELADSLHAVLQSQTGSHFPVLLLPPQLHPNQHWHSALLSAGQSSCQQNYRVSLLLTQIQHTQQAPALSKQQASTCSQHAPSLPHDGYHDSYPTAGVPALKLQALL